MTGAADRDAIVRAYLLGSLPPEEAASIDEQVVTDAAVHEEVLAAQDDLIHAYLAGALSAPERERFESHFLASPRRRERVAFVRSLRAAVARGEASVPRARTAAVPRRWTAALPWAAAVAIGLASGAWSLGERRRADAEIADAQERERALAASLVEQREQIAALRAQGPAGDVVTWVLATGRLRAAGDPVPHRAQPRGWIRLRAPIEADPGTEALVASVQTPEGREIARVGAQRTHDAGAGPVVDAIVSAAQLPRGTYVLSIQSARDPAQEWMAATFTVR